MTTAASKQTASSRIKRTSTVFTIFNVIIMAILVLITIYPFYYVIVGSISGNNVGAQEVYFLYPVDLDFGAYNMVFSTTSIPRAYMNTVFVTVVGTTLSLLLTILTAYPLSKSRLRGRSFFTMLFYFTMLFSGGLIPTYLGSSAIWHDRLPLVAHSAQTGFRLQHAPDDQLLQEYPGRLGGIRHHRRRERSHNPCSHHSSAVDAHSGYAYTFLRRQLLEHLV